MFSYYGGCTIDGGVGDEANYIGYEFGRPDIMPQALFRYASIR
jgi:hypothetical protein